ncbi:Pantothenate kinase 4 [Allomyces arbusculus]|nr:Pantothenate kinase 4 [Allomyces arbusculus]
MTVSAPMSPTSAAARSSWRLAPSPDLVVPPMRAQVALDIGGSLAKVVAFIPPRAGGPKSSGRLHFSKYETAKIDECITYVRDLLRANAADAADGKDGLLEDDVPVVHATGGGAHKFHAQLERELGVTVVKHDEMECLVQGLNFLLREVPNEVFSYNVERTDITGPPNVVFEEVQTDPDPYLLVNIGSGVSILKVTGPGAYERVSGTSLGGGTFWGLLSMLAPDTGAKGFDAMLDLTRTGDHRAVDMLVGDIYGSDPAALSTLQLDPNLIASSCGKLLRLSPEQRAAIPAADIARSLLRMVANNIAQIAYLCAQAHNLDRIYFGGCFLRGHAMTMAALSAAVAFWSQGTTRAYFVRHEGHLGALGAYLHHAPPELGARIAASPGSAGDAETVADADAAAVAARMRSNGSRRWSFLENFTVADKFNVAAPVAYGVLDAAPARLVPFPKLPMVSGKLVYAPDTFTLASAADQRYWLDILDARIAGMVRMAVDWNQDVGDEVDVKQRAAKFESEFRRHLDALRSQPAAYGVLSVRSLLHLREQSLREAGFEDLFYPVKQAENAVALRALPQVLHDVDALPDAHAQVLQLLDNALAGNVFDWGCTAILDQLADGSLDLVSARAKVRRPPHADDARVFADHVTKHPYRKIVLFPDNSGADVVLGVLPLARFFVQQGASVVVAVNSGPAINDVTFSELLRVMGQVSDMDEVVARALESRRLQILASGSESPCLDLSRVDESLAREAEDADLVVIIGMGRAIHTNFHAVLDCDVLRVAVFKNEFTAHALGFDNFDALVRWTRAGQVPGSTARLGRNDAVVGVSDIDARRA